MMMKGTR